MYLLKRCSLIGNIDHPMHLLGSFKVAEVSGGLDPFSPWGLLLLIFGFIFTVGLPIIMIMKGKKD